MRDLTILSPSAGINADSQGYAGGHRKGNPNQTGMGPGGGGILYVSVWGSGGGYGGKGGDSSTGSLGGGTNGFANAPTGAGSGGMSYNGNLAGDGGGSVRIEASRAVQVDGTITANGSNPIWDINYSGAGSGGGIFVICQTFGGGASSLLSAKGGNSNAGYTGAGGGGRIAVWYGEPATPTVRSQLFAGQTPNFVYTTNDYSGFSGSKDIAGGTAWSNGALGSVVFLTYIPPPAGSLILVR